MTPDIWERMTPAEQADFWWNELNGMIEEALQELRYQPGNQETVVIPGMTTIVTRSS